jgi:hypothetical protein
MGKKGSEEHGVPRDALCCSSVTVYRKVLVRFEALLCMYYDLTHLFSVKVRPQAIQLTIMAVQPNLFFRSGINLNCQTV